MRHSIILGLVLAITLTASAFAGEPPSYILDTDLASDCDDAGAVAMVNALADNGQVNVLAMMVSTGGRTVGPALGAINTWYGHGGWPIGVLKDETFWVGGSPDQPAGWMNFESYTRTIAETCPTPLKDGRDAPDAKILYRQILAKQPDSSVTIQSIGPLINLAMLLETKADDASPLSGTDLVAAKVKVLVITGGRNPKGTSSNFSKAGAAKYAKPVIDHWPSPIVFVGNDVGSALKVGWTKNRDQSEGNPARLAYKLFFKGDDTKTRACADQAGVLYAIKGLGEIYSLVETGHQTCDEKGNTEWSPEPLKDGRKHAYLQRIEGKDAAIVEQVESLMTQGKKAAGK